MLIIGLDMEILFEDESMLVVNKPAGVLVHPVEGILQQNVLKEETCISILRTHCKTHVFPVHRLDRATSGTVIFAKSSAVASLLCKQIEAQEVEKQYVALVRGWLRESVCVCHPVWNDIRTRKVDAQTQFFPLEEFEIAIPSGKNKSSRYSYVSALPKTGRYHQIRQHLKHLSHPIVGDSTHGDGVHNKIFRNEFNSHRLLLHAVSLSFMHPVKNIPVKISCVLPMEFELVLQNLREFRKN